MTGPWSSWLKGLGRRVMAPRARWLFLLGILAGAYWLSRLYRLTLLPMFLDEAIHLRWALRLLDDGLAWKPWLHGRLLNIWVKAVFVDHFEDYLWAGRFVSVLAGFVGWLACYLAGLRLFDRRTAWCAAAFHVCCPFVLFHHRLALADTFLSAFSGLTLYWTVRCVEEPRLRHSLWLGIVMALGVLSKIPGLLLFCVPLFGLVLRQPGDVRWRAAIIRAYLVGLALVGYPVWRFVRHTPLADHAALTGAQPWLGGLVAQNLLLAAQWLAIYWTVPLLLLALAGLLKGLRRGSRQRLFLALAAALPVLVFVLIAAHWYPRYLLFASIPFLLLAAAGFWDCQAYLEARLGSRALVTAGLALLALGPSLRFDYLLLTDPRRAPLPRIDRDAYINGWTSGYGISEAGAFIDGQLAASDHDIFAVTPTEAEQSTFRTLDLRFRRNPRVCVKRLDLRQPSGLQRLAEMAAERTVYIVVSPACDFQSPRCRRISLALTPAPVLVATTAKPDHQLWHEIYRWPPPGPTRAETPRPVS